MFAPVGRINDVALCVSVRMPPNTTLRRAPEAIVPSPVMVVVPVVGVVYHEAEASSRNKRRRSTQAEMR